MAVAFASLAGAENQMDRSDQPVAIGSRIIGGPFDGLKVGQLTNPTTGSQILIMIPDVSKPVPAQIKPIIETFIRAHEQRKPELFGKVAATDALLFAGCVETCAPEGLLVDKRST